MTDEQERVEWHTLRDAMLDRCMRENPGYTREECIEAMALTFWRIIADRIEPDGTYTGTDYVELAFQEVFKGYGAARDRFTDDSYIMFLRGRLTSAVTYLQRATGRLK